MHRRLLPLLRGTRTPRPTGGRESSGPREGAPGATPNERLPSSHPRVPVSTGRGLRQREAPDRLVPAHAVADLQPGEPPRADANDAHPRRPPTQPALGAGRVTPPDGVDGRPGTEPPIPDPPADCPQGSRAVSRVDDRRRLHPEVRGRRPLQQLGHRPARGAGSATTAAAQDTEHQKPSSTAPPAHHADASGRVQTRSILSAARTLLEAATPVIERHDRPSRQPSRS